MPASHRPARLHVPGGSESRRAFATVPSEDELRLAAIYFIKTTFVALSGAIPPRILNVVLTIRGSLVLTVVFSVAGGKSNCGFGDGVRILISVGVRISSDQFRTLRINTPTRQAKGNRVYVGFRQFKLQ